MNAKSYCPVRIRIPPLEVQHGTPLICASKNGHRDIVDLLLKGGADVNANDACRQTALMWAAEKGHPDIVNLPLDKGADINARDCVGRTVLVRSIHGSQPDVAKMLLEWKEWILVQVRRVWHLYRQNLERGMDEEQSIREALEIGIPEGKSG